MWDKILIAAGAALIVLIAGLGANYAIKQWKLKYREELKTWLLNHPNHNFKTIGLKIVYGIDSVAVTGSRVTVAIFGTQESGQKVEVSTKRIADKEAEKMGLLKNNVVHKEEIGLYNKAEILSLTNS